MECVKIIIDTDTVDSCETFECKCSKCMTEFTMGCYSSRQINYCPNCGVRVQVELIND
jgi:hypothetical protein